MGLGTTDHIFTLNTIIYNTLKSNLYLCSVFLDVEKAFDKANFNSIIDSLANMSASQDAMQYICNLNKNFKVSLGTGDACKTINTSNVLKQGSVLSLVEFGAVIDHINNLALEKTNADTVDL